MSDRLIFNLISYIFISFIALICFIPLLMVVSSSFTSETNILRHGYSIIPRGISFEGYGFLLKSPETILRAYGVTTIVTVIGTAVGLYITAMTAYVIQRKDFEWRNIFSLFFFFTALFSGGLVPWYILIVTYLKLTDNLLALILPPLLNVFFLLLMKGFMQGIPSAISESAKIDGAGDFSIFRLLILPLSKPALATIGLFMALNYWNDWFHSMLFIQDQNMYSLQYYLYSLINNARALEAIASRSPSGNVVQRAPIESMKMALTVVVTGPIVFLYPFIQRYFVKGITLGAVKG